MPLKKKNAYALVLICIGMLVFSNTSFAQQTTPQPQIAPQPQPAGTPKAPPEPVKQFKTTKKTNADPSPKAPSKTIKRTKRKSRKATKKQDDDNRPDAGPASVANAYMTDNQFIAYTREAYRHHSIFV